ncbi:sensor histidine kinase [Hymenobacter perfusus]|uniref:Oxygen sensor histidine kinase NreB n=1 Tax=Hymenobacter perfusus TaxID=1236770 RepID=A0A3R9N6G2_9BACT|nr:sensor histidine kinase [Hymenobacter perfusus]RSK40092.1 hypothetical protein EI293_19160 [Hymenobacter perfusus]
MGYRYFFCLLVLLQLPELLRAQPAVVPVFHSITTPEGLASGSVFTVAQDRRGFVWLGTQDGLVRYDGGSARTFRNDPQRPGSLSSNYILALAEDPAGNLWIGTGGGGVCRYSPLNGQFQIFQKTAPDTTGLTDGFVRAVLADGQGKVWVGTEGGLHRWNTHRRRFQQYPVVGSQGVRSNSIRAMAQTTDGRLWVGTGNGQLAWLDTLRQEVVPLPGFQAGSPVSALAAAPDGTLWVGTEAHGLYRLGAAASGGAISAYQAGGLTSGSIRALCCTAQNQLWIGTTAGLSALEPATGRLTTYRHQPSQPWSLPSDAVQSIFQDKTGLLWIATDKGVVRFEGRPSAFRMLPLPAPPSGVWAVLEAPDGAVWAGTETQGLVRVGPAAGQRRQFRHEPRQPGSLSQDYVRALCLDRAGRLWVGTQNQGLECLEPGAGRFRHFRHQARDPASLGDDFVRALYEDSRGRIWVGTEGGLSQYTPATGRFRTFRHDPANAASLSNNFVRVMLQDRRRDVLWIGTGGGGLNCLDLRTGRFRSYQANARNPRSLSSNFVRSLLQDQAGTLWIGTEGGGLCRLDDAATGRFTTYREPQGLPNDVVYGLLQDMQGYLWLSTNRGLARFQPRTHAVITFNQRDGLGQDEYNAGAACQGRNGQLYFGGINGLVVFQPAGIQPNTQVPPVVLTGLRRLNQPLELPDTTITERRTLRLTPQDYVFTLEFAALNYRQPEKNRYAYLLEGFDPDWIPAGTRREATYSNLDPGMYTFRVRATNNDGVWNPVGAALRIIVNPPWYRSWWFRIGLSWVLFAVLFLLYRLRVRQLLALEQVRHGIARDLHDDMGSTLSSISILSQVARHHQRQNRPEQAAAVLEQIGDSSRRMLDAMDDIVWAINPAHDGLDDVTARMRRLASEVLESAGIEFTFRADAALQSLRFDMRARREFFLLFKEAINNLAKYARCRHAAITLEYRQGHLLLTVQDDGVGFDQQAPAQGGGNGLTNMRTRAAALHGELTIRTAPGQGTTLLLSVPMH